MQIAVIGAGPSGLYCADYLAKKAPDCHIDLYDQSPEPFGLLRYGVAPDHHITKRLAIPLQKVLDRSNVRFIPNITIGKTLTAEQLHEHYNVIVLAAGASEDRLLSITPPPSLPYYAAGQLAHWYNDANPNLAPKLGNTIALFGQGNVAIDLARLLSKDTSALLEASLNDEVVEALTEQRDQRTIYLIGRGQAHDAKCTTDMLTELLELPEVTVTQSGADLSDTLPSSVPEAELRARARNLDLFRSLSETPSSNAKVHIQFRFNELPDQITSDNDTHRLHLRANRADVLSVDRSPIMIDTLLSAIGFIPKEVAGFGEASECEFIDHPAKVYAVGWYAHGAKGVIQSNRVPAVAVAKEIIADAQHSIESGKTGYDGIKALLDSAL
jgi:hypothetical protein